MSENCPLCGFSLSIPTAVKKTPVIPQPGDFTVCLSCHSVLTFNNECRLRILTKEELQFLEADANFWNHLIGAIHTMRTLPRVN